MRDFLYRLTVLFTNLFFAPFAVAMLSGFSTDTIINCALLLLAIIPSHIHGFYLSCVYFHRRSKVKKGRYPGGAKSFIYSSSILNGGYSNQVVDDLYHRKTTANGNSRYRQSYRVESSDNEHSPRTGGPVERWSSRAGDEREDVSVRHRTSTRRQSRADVDGRPRSRAY